MHATIGLERAGVRWRDALPALVAVALGAATSASETARHVGELMAATELSVAAAMLAAPVPVWALSLEPAQRSHADTEHTRAYAPGLDSSCFVKRTHAPPPPTHTPPPPPPPSHAVQAKQRRSLLAFVPACSAMHPSPTTRRRPH